MSADLRFGKKMHDRDMLSCVRDPGLSFMAIIMETQTRDKLKKAIKRWEILEKLQVYVGCYVRMNHTNTLQIIRSFTRDGFVNLMTGHWCSHTDFKVILLLPAP